MENIDLTKASQRSEPVIEMLQGDAATELQKLSSMSFDLVITSPPYNIGKEYEEVRSIEEYLENQEVIIEQLVDLVSEEGSICWQVGNMTDPKTRGIIPLDIYYYPLFVKYGMTLKNRIIWHFGHGLHSSNRFSGRYETILWFTKNTSGYIFNLDEVRERQKYPGKRHFRGPNKGKLSGNPKGKNPSDVWQIVLRDWESEIWDIPNVKANHREKTIELVSRCILALTNPGSWILDPYAGVGSTLLAAYESGRNAIGIELHQRYVDIAQNRLELLRAGRLPIRPISKPVYDPSKSKLSQLPPEFDPDADKR
jgi:adenine-specific DNA-methyltransferase